MSTVDPVIKQLQKDLLVMGFDPGTPDGLIGSNTRGAAHDAAQDLKLVDFQGGAIPQALIDELHTRALLQFGNPTVELPPEYYDMTKLATSGWKKYDRAWAQIQGITLHQTGCPMGETPSRWFSLKAHYGITRSGKIYRIRKETDFGWHAQGQSHHNIGLEISGFFAGEEGNPKTRPGDGGAGWAIQSVTDEQIVAVKALIRYLCKLVAAHGGLISLLQAHRQATDDRTPDPGSKVWQTIAIPMLQELNLSVGAVTGKGMELPDSWTGQKRGIPYLIKR